MEEDCSVFFTPEITETRSIQPTGLDQNTPTRTPSGNPKMGILFKDIGNIIVGYFSKLGFLVNQAASYKVFGYKPTILDKNLTTSQDSKSTDRSLYSFGAKCSFDVFLNMCIK